MFLRIANRHAEQRARDDDGAALLSVIAVMAIVMVIALALMGSVTNAVGFSSTTRAQTQARSSAESGIDIVWAGIEQGTFYCTLTSGATSDVRFSATVKYYSSANALLPCSGTSSLTGTPSKAVITSVGTAVSKGVGGASSGNTKTVNALLDIVVTPGSVNLDRAVFSDGTMTVTNDVTISDPTGLNQASIYSNGNVTCATQVPIQGNVYTQGNFDVNNNCKIAGSVWAGGSVNMSSSVQVSGDVMSMGGTSTPATGVTVSNSAWIGGSLVANGSVTMDNNGNVNCPIAGYSARVCGSIVSIEGSVTANNGSLTVGNMSAKGDIALGTVNSSRMVGGNVTSSTGNVTGSNISSSGIRIGGYVAAYGTSSFPKAVLGNAASSCASGTSGFTPCSPTRSPAISLAGLPAVLNFPTNTRVVAPPRESLIRVNSDTTAMAKWTGWTKQNVACTEAAVRAKVATAWSGKLLLTVTGCTAPLPLNGGEMSLPGDLVLMSAAGFSLSNDVKVKSSVVGASRDFMMIVPSDAKLANGTTPLVTWTTPIATDPAYTKPVCNPPSGTPAYGNIAMSKMILTNVKEFFYTPCKFSAQNALVGFTGQVYGGTVEYPNNSVISFTKMNVPGAVSPSAVLASITATQTARFDVQG